MKFDNPEALRDAVIDNGDILTVKVGTVRDAFNYGRLGVHVRKEISKKLRGLGIAHLPAGVPDWQEQPIRLYRMGTPIAELLDAAHDPTAEHDEELKNAVSGSAADILNQVRAIVCA
jgi:hypothetical protein